MPTKSRDIRPFLHLYIGHIEVDFGHEVRGKLTGYSELYGYEILDSKGVYKYVIPVNIKADFRPLSSITEEEATEIVIKIWKKIYSHDTDVSDCRIVEGEEDNAFGFTCKDEDGDIIGLTINTERGIEFSVNGRMMNVDQFEITVYLLSKGFDLFNLIPNGLADSSTIPQPSSTPKQ